MNQSNTLKWGICWLKYPKKPGYPATFSFVGGRGGPDATIYLLELSTFSSYWTSRYFTRWKLPEFLSDSFPIFWHANALPMSLEQFLFPHYVQPAHHQCNESMSCLVEGKVNQDLQELNYNIVAKKLMYPWGQSKGVWLALPAQRTLLQIVFSNRYGEKDICQMDSQIAGTKRHVNLPWQWNHIWYRNCSWNHRLI